MNFSRNFSRPPTIHRTIRSILPVPPTIIPPRCACIVTVQPQLVFRPRELWTYSPGELLVENIHVGNICMFVGHGKIPAACWDIVEVTRAVEASIAAGWKPPPDDPDAAHPFYGRLKIDFPTANIGVVICFLLENPTDEPIVFKASLHGLTIDDGGWSSGGHNLITDDGDPHRRLRHPSDASDSEPPPTDPAPGSPPRSSSSRPATSSPRAATSPVPRGAADTGSEKHGGASMDPKSAECRTCGAKAGAKCMGVKAGTFHPSRGRKKGECSGCPRAAWAGGIKATCTFCGRTG